MKFKSYFLTIIISIFCTMQMIAAAIPTEYIGDGKWVTLKTENGYYFYALEEGGQIKLGQTQHAPTAANYAAYCWQIEGNATDGYRFCCLKYENVDGTVTPPANKRYITNPATLATNNQEVLLTNTPSYYYFTANHQLQLKADNTLYLAFYSSRYNSIRLHNSADYIGSKMIIGGIYDWSVAAVVYGTEEDGEGHPQGTYLPGGGVSYDSQNYLHGSSLTLSDEALSHLSLIDVTGYRKSTIKIDTENRYVVAYYVGDSDYTYLNATTTKDSHPVITGANNTVWSLDAKNYITNTSGHYTNVPNNKAWQMEMIVQNTTTEGQTDPSFNKWGSCILSSNGDPLNTYYWGDFQIYQHAPTHSSPNTLNFKSSKADGNDHIIAQGASVKNKSYKVIVRFNGNNIYIIRTIILDNNLQETNQVYNNVWVSARPQNPITQMSCALPTGLNLHTLKISIAEESNLLDGVDYAIQNKVTKDYLNGGSSSNSYSAYAGDAAKLQIEWTGSQDLTYSEGDGGLHNSFYIKVVDADKYLGASNTLVGDKSSAQPFIYTTNNRIAPITAKNTLGTEWAINTTNNTWDFDFFANFYVEVAGNNNGGLLYQKGGKQQTATNGNYIELPSGVLVEQMANSSQVGYSAAISKADIRLKVAYTPLDNTFYNITEKSSSQTNLYYWYKDQNKLVTYSTTNSQSGNVTEWGDKGDCSKYTIEKAASIPVKLNRDTQGDNKYYGSIYCPNPLTLPEGVRALRLEKVDDDKYLLRPILSNGAEVKVLPANTPAVLVSDSESDLSGNWPLNLNDWTPAPTVNLFTGSYVDKDNPGSGQGANSSIYVLSGKNGIGFYPYTGAMIPAFKPYYEAPQATQQNISRFMFVFDDVETSCMPVVFDDVATTPSVVYDLMGRRVSAVQKGRLYIINGKKCLIK